VTLPVDGDGECIKVLRIEMASLPELADAFLEATKGFVVPAGSVVVLTSASRLTEVRTAKYSREFVAARTRLMGAFQGGIMVVHGFPIPTCGINDTGCIRSLTDILDWLASVTVNTNRDLVQKTGAGNRFA
jgi:hypothetical protein